MTEKVVIQILTFNAIEKIRVCLDSLKWIIEEPNIKLVVIDNASSEPVAEMIREDYAFAQLIENDANTGFAKGHNTALKYSLAYEPDFILVLNPDTTISKEALMTMLSKFASDNTIGLVGPKIKNNEGNIEKSINIEPSIWHYVLKIFSLRLDEIRTKDKYQTDSYVEAVTGACMLIKTDVIKTIGLFDEDFFFYIEDTEFCFRIRKSGKKILFTPDAEILHSHSSSTISHTDPENWRKTQYYKSSLVYFKKCKGRIQFHIFKLFRISEMLIRITFGLNREWAVKMLKYISNFN